jgi:hypothetical protein
MKTLIVMLLSGAACFAGDPPTTLLPQPVLVIQQNGQLVITDKNPIPLVIVNKLPQQNPPLWTTSTGQVLMPLNIQAGEGTK